MVFHIITIFPDVFKDYFQEGVIGRGVKKEKISIKIYNLRDYTQDKHRKVDDAPCGGGPGMVLQVQPIYDCVQDIKKKIKKRSKTKIILFSARGKCYNQKSALGYAGYDDLILICGRYEGVDERVAKYIADEEISIGEYILTGGELPAMVLVDSISRLVPEVLGNKKSLVEESYNPGKNNAKHDYPVYTRPDNFRGWKVPKVLLSGNHKKIKEWRDKNK